jgi:hypothetical protein
MRPWTGAVLLALGTLVAMPAGAQERVYPSARGEPLIEPGRRGLPPADPRLRVPDREPLRAPGGEVEGFNDQSRLGRRGVARDRAGTATGTVDPGRLGGGVVRDSDGTARGMAPSGPRQPEFDPRRRR